MDGLFLYKNNKPLFIECKNSHAIHQNHLTNFLGKMRLIDSIYDINTLKYLISTGRQYFTKGFNRYNRLKDLKIYGNFSYNKGYKDMLEKTKNYF